MPPLQALGQEDLIDPAPLDRDPLLLVEIGLEAIERPGAVGLAQVLRVGQGRGDDLGALLGGVGGPPPRPPPLLQAVDPLLMEPVDPGVDGGPGDAEFLGDPARALPPGDGRDDAGALDEAGLGRSGVGQSLESPEFLVRWFAEGDVVEDHGCTPFRSYILPTSHPDRQFSCRMHH